MTINLHLTAHARETMARRDVPYDVVEGIVARPTLTHTRADGTTVHKRDGLAVVTAPGLYPGERRVVTVLLDTVERWDDAAIRAHRAA